MPHRNTIYLPLLTEYDPPSSSEGTLDPLGLYAIADSLAVQLVPGIRERQLHPRFLTAIAVSTAVCSEFDVGTYASDKRSEPWQVFEWYMVEGLVRTIPDDIRLRGLPGREKVAFAIRDKVPLSAERYLKTPNVFGYHGVYRLLSHTLGIEENNRLGSAGFDLLSIWAREQGLGGFYGTTSGPGKNWYDKLFAAVKDGLEKGAVDRKDGWSGWYFFRDYLAHLDISRRERAAITKFLKSSEDGFRREILEFLCSDEGKLVWQGTESERKFHKKLRTQRHPTLNRKLLAIDKYERFSRMLQDAFDDCRFVLTREQRKVSPVELSGLQSVQMAAEHIPSLFMELMKRLVLFDRSVQFQESFRDISQELPPADWVVCLIEHHRSVQEHKPPDGKAPWVERFDDGTYMIRPAYRKSEMSEGSREYIHQYRTRPLWSFATDLRLLG